MLEFLTSMVPHWRDAEGGISAAFQIDRTLDWEVVAGLVRVVVEHPLGFARLLFAVRAPANVPDQETSRYLQAEAIYRQTLAIRSRHQGADRLCHAAIIARSRPQVNLTNASMH